MTRRDKLIADLLSGRADANFDFDDLRAILLGFGFEERSSGAITCSGVRESKNA
jgi:hypothetical protein